MKFLRRQKPLPLFLLFLIILTIGEGVGMGLASYFHKPLSGLETFQMMIPATAAFLVFRILAGQTQPFPKYVCRAFFAADILDRCCLGKCASSGILKSNCESNIGFDRYSIF